MTFFNELFEYNHAVNQKLAEVFMENPGKTSANSLKLTSHILNAHLIWISRINERDSPCGVWELQQTSNLKKIDKKNFEDTLITVEQFKPDHHVRYVNSKGQGYSNTVRDILFHIINHSTYHRGQIASDMRQSGLQPVITDYIFYRRP
jgi:uncharacterized damage-inducible protein DinB